MIGIDPHLLQVIVLTAYPDAFLGVCSAFPTLSALINPILLSQKDRFERVHSGVDEQQCWIVSRYNRHTVYNQVFLLSKKLQKIVPDFAGCFHNVGG